MGTFFRRVGMALVLTALADVFLFHESLGVGLTFFCLCVGGVAVARWGARLLHARLWLFVWCALVVVAAVEPSATGLFLLILLGWAIVAMAELGAGCSLFEALVRGTTGGLRSFVAAPHDTRRAVLISTRRAPSGVIPVRLSLVPIVITLLFALLIVPANLVLSRWIAELADTVHSLASFDAVRFVFWIAIFAGVYGLMRFRLGQHPGHARRRSAYGASEDNLARELKTCVTTLILTNLLFLAANATDLAFLWLRFDLPDGMSYSEYAHRGSYRLIVAVVLAAFMIVVFFRSNARPREHRMARALAAVFVVQNILVLAGAASRLGLYADAYGLTRFRVATMFWLALVAVGFVLLGLRILQNRSFRFLMDGNAASTLIVLSCWAGLDVDGYVADRNVARHTRDPSVAMDVDYLGELGVGALPALARLVHDKDLELAARAEVILRRRTKEERANHQHWAEWSYRSHVALREAEHALAEVGVRTD